MLFVFHHFHSALDAESERIVQDALDKLIKGNAIFISKLKG